MILIAYLRPDQVDTGGQILAIKVDGIASGALWFIFQLADQLTFDIVDRDIHPR